MSEEKKYEFKYDLFQHPAPDTPTLNPYGSPFPYGFGYDPNQPDTIWPDKKLSEVPSTCNYVHPSVDMSFDPTPGLVTPYTVGDIWTPLTHKNMTFDYKPLPCGGVNPYANDVNAGCLYELQYHAPLRAYNPFEPARPFTNYDPRSIRAEDPIANPYGFTQEEITGMVNRSNYFSDFGPNMVNYLNNSSMSPANIDNPYNQLVGPSYIGTDGQLHIMPAGQDSNYTPRRKFIKDENFPQNIPVIGADQIGESMYPVDPFATMKMDINANNVDMSNPWNQALLGNGQTFAMMDYFNNNPYDPYAGLKRLEAANTKNMQNGSANMNYQMNGGYGVDMHSSNPNYYQQGLDRYNPVLSPWNQSPYQQNNGFQNQSPYGMLAPQQMSQNPYPTHNPYQQQAPQQVSPLAAESPYANTGAHYIPNADAYAALQNQQMNNQMNQNPYGYQNPYQQPQQSAYNQSQMNQNPYYQNPYGMSAPMSQSAAFAAINNDMCKSGSMIQDSMYMNPQYGMMPIPPQMMNPYQQPMMNPQQDPRDPRMNGFQNPPFQNQSPYGSIMGNEPIPNPTPNPSEIPTTSNTVTNQPCNPSGFTSLNPPMKEVNIDGIKMQMPTEIPSVDGKQNKSDPVIDMLFNISNKNNNENGSSVNK